MVIGPIAVGNFDVFIGIIAIVVWLLAQITSKRAKSDAPPPPPPVPGAGEPVSPQDDLRRFFEELERNINQPPPPAASTPPALPSQPGPAARPATAQAPVRPHRQNRPAHVHRPPPVQAPPPKPATVPAPAPDPVFVPVMGIPVQAAMEPKEFKWEHPAPTLANGIPSAAGAQPAPYRRRMDLRSKENARKTIIGAEILGKPLALR